MVEKKYSRARDCVLYFNIVKFHEEIFPDNNPVNAWQLMYITGMESYGPDIDLPKKYISHLKLCEFGVHHSGSIINRRDEYPWKELINSISKEGLKKPILAERYINKKIITYRAFEGKHRLLALSLIKPFDKNRLVSCVIVDYNEEYSKKMFLQPHPNPFLSSGFNVSKRR